ncbi:threonine synthase [Entomophthora muscae]|uniref:Threonine synthase n=1 Tax=Entomophthora muscae TaxID=34485 RepID=A0ACC2TUA0_9FUNG|nr:threonine synthase [Entomophthora muscae]
MGLPIERLIIATNQNDILHRVFTAGAYSKDAEQGVQPTNSPAMDILVSSNFERLLWYLANTGDVPQACATLTKWMSEFASTGQVQLPEAALIQLRKWFSSYTINDAKTVEIIRDFYTATPSPYLLDPHTAVGVGAALELKAQLSPTPIVCLATAHPAKFQAAVQLATQKSPDDRFDFDSIMGQGYLPEPFREWMNPNLPRRCHRLTSAEPQAVQDLIASIVRQ